MDFNMDRRSFLGVAAAALVPVATAAESPVRIGVVGVGNRGSNLLRLMLAMKDVSVPALCDIDAEHPLSQESIAKGSALVVCPDFTRGRWQTRKPSFGV